MYMNLILGNGINYEQFADKHWSKLTSNFDKHIQVVFSELKPERDDSIIHTFLSKIIINVLEEKELEKKLMFANVHAVPSIVDLDEWLWLTSANNYFSPEIMTAWWKLSNNKLTLQDTPENLLFLISDPKWAAQLSTLSFCFFTTLDFLFTTAIQRTLQEDYDVNNLEYSKDFINYLSKFKNIFSLNVDGILNKANLPNVRYPHGFFNYKKPEKYIIETKNKVKNQDPLLFEIYNLVANIIVASPSEVLFDYSSESKKVNIDWNKAQATKVEYEIFKDENDKYCAENTKYNNDNYSNIDLDSYAEIAQMSGNTTIIGLSYKGDEEIFKILAKNKNIEEIHYFGDNIEFLEIEKLSDKFIYCGFWKKGYY